jgi:outer membrane protein assembly factor BamB
MNETAVASESVLQRPAEGGKGIVYALDGASGTTLWTRRFSSPLFGCATVARDVVFAPTYDGRVFGLSARDGSTLWSTQLQAGINSCPAVAGNDLVLAVGAPHSAFAHPVAEIVSFGLSNRR